MGGFLETGNIANYKNEYMTFFEAKDFVQKLQLKSSVEYRMYCLGKFKTLPQKPINLPVAVGEVYKGKGWKGFQDFLGYQNPRTSLVKEWINYDEAKQIIKAFKVKSNKEWRSFAKSSDFPIEVPKSPDKVYSRKLTWKGWADFLGNN